ncbi:DUF3592 domain-containing protein [Chryseolinea sp. T2]|uniref:DUF3592 domain-containing protein n=1 Tax=Chryseolinea sp. T2 TaxID=3129255 RepID=UPI003076E13C
MTQVALISILFFSLFILIGLYAYRWGSRERRKWRGSNTWVKAAATLRSVSLKDKTDSDLHTTHSVEVLYQYEFQSAVYESATICFAYTPSGSLDFHSKIYNTLKDAKEIEIWVNPSKPNESVIARGLAPSSNFVSRFGMVFILVGLMMMIIFLLFEVPHDSSLIDQIQTFK